MLSKFLYKIFQEKFYFIDDGPYLESLDHVIDHYSRMADGLPTNLTCAVTPSMSFEKLPFSGS